MAATFIPTTTPTTRTASPRTGPQRPTPTRRDRSAGAPTAVPEHDAGLPDGYVALIAPRPGRFKLAGGPGLGPCGARSVHAGEVLGFVMQAGTVEPIVAPHRGVVITSARSGSLVHRGDPVVRLAPI